MEWMCSCKGGGRVLIWHDSNLIILPKTPYEPYPVDYRDEYSGDIHDYKLIIWSLPVSIPSWWETIAADEWAGRLVIIGEWVIGSQGWGTNNAFINSNLSPTIGMSIINAAIDPTAALHLGPSEGGPLMAGQTFVAYAATSLVSSGTPLALTTTSQPFISRNKPGNADFVLSGDTNPFHNNSLDGFIEYNAAFLFNLADVAL